MSGYRDSRGPPLPGRNHVQSFSTHLMAARRLSNVIQHYPRLHEAGIQGAMRPGRQLGSRTTNRLRNRSYFVNARAAVPDNLCMKRRRLHIASDEIGSSSRSKEFISPPTLSHLRRQGETDRARCLHVTTTRCWTA